MNILAYQDSKLLQSIAYEVRDMISETEGREEKGPNRVPFINDPAKPANPERVREQGDIDDPELPDDNDSYKDT